MTGKKISSIVFVGVLVLLAGFTAVKVWAGGCKSNYCDSDTITVQTSAVPPIPSQPYTVSCQPYNSAIFVTWQGSSSTVQEVDLLRVSGNNVYITPSGHITNPTTVSSVWYAPQSQGGNYTYSDYPSPPGSYTYILRVMQSPTNFSYSNQTTCSVGGSQGPTSSDAPTLVQAFANSPSTIYLNWKDNSTSSAGTYQFVVQRMKVTPNNPTSTSVSATEDTPTDVFTTVNWKDNTTSTTYYGSIERSTSTYFATTNQFHYENNSQVPVLTKITGTPWIPDSMSPTKNFSQTDGVVNGSLNDATTYYYRVRECSTVALGGFYASSTGNAVLNSGPDGQPNIVCTWPSAALSVTTPPYAPTNLTTSVNGTSEIDLSWVNNSTRASSIQIFRNGSYLTTVSSSTTLYQNTGLSSDTRYTYTVRASYTGYDAALGRNVTVYSNQSTSSSATTDFVVSVKINPTGGGSVTSNPTGINCGGTGSCSASFSNGTQVALNASPAVNYVFNSWSCTGNCGSSYGPQYHVSGTANVTATFVLSAYSGFTTGASGKIALRGVMSSIVGFFDGAAQSIASAVSNAAQGVASGFGKVIALLTAPSTAEGQTTPYDPYFVSVTTTTNPAVVDGGLSSDTVYVYRVKVHYTDGRANPDSAWSAWSAAKTLISGTNSTGKPVPICTANSVCNQGITGAQSSDLSGFGLKPQQSGLQIEKSEGQCLTNADCISVGRVNNIFQEK